MGDKVKKIPDDEIDIIDIIKKIWGGRIFIFKWTSLFIILGIIVVLLTKKQFTASSTFIPQTSESYSNPSINGLASAMQSTG